MKKAFALLLASAAVLAALPFAPVTAEASSSDAAVIDMHGAKTWLGTTSSWSKKWNEDNFEDVTGEDVRYSGSLTVKAGSVDDITVNGSNSKLIVKDVKAGDIYCEGKTEITDSSVKSVESDGDITVSDSTARGSVVSDNGEVTLKDGSVVKGDVTGDDISLPSGATVSVSGSITGKDHIYLDNCTLKAQKLCGSDTCALQADNYKSTLPPLVDMDDIIVEDGELTSNDDILAGSLYIKDGAEFITNSALELDDLQGPGTLYFNAGKLIVHSGITGSPLFVFKNTVSNGTSAFKADKNCVSTSDVRLYDYQLQVDTSGGYDVFKLRNDLKEGLSFNISVLTVSKNSPGTVSATVKPALSKFADGTKIKWELYGDDSAYSISASSTGESCKVSLSGSSSGMHSATLTAYLVDKKGDRLSDYRSDSCLVKSGYDDIFTTTSSSGSVKLDTDYVSLLPGNTYWVLATTSASQMPHAMSYNSAVATVGAGKQVKDKSGNQAWLYPVTGVSSGKVTIDIDGQKMLTKVSSGIIVDTASYTMAPGGKYCVGVKVKGVQSGKLSVYTTGSCCSVNLLKDTNGDRLYQVTGTQAGSGYVVFYIEGGEVISTKIDVQNGAQAGGKSARLVALA